MSEFRKEPDELNPADEKLDADKPAEELTPAARFDDSATESNADYDENEATEQEKEAKPAAAPVAKAPWPWIAIAVIAVIALIVVLVRDTGGAGGEAVGELNGKKITKAELMDELIKQSGEATIGSQLDQVMMYEVIDAEYEKTGKKVNDADVDAYIKNIREQNGITSDEQFESVLASSGMTVESFRENVLPQLKLRLIFENKQAPTEDELKAYYEENKDSFGTPEQVRASHILLSTKEEAEAVLKQLKEGADFATLAKEKSIDTVSAENGGDLDYFGKGQMNEEFETAAFALKVGELSDVVESPNGYHIIKVADHKDAVTPAYEEVKAEVKNQYLDSKINDGFSDWYEGAKKSNGYKNFLTDEDAAAASPEASEEPSASASASPEASASASASASE
ncbi:peptidylprolyl isomerase [Cohnella thailandensis]|uniref:Foldase protein PrsA n=1 Tax=Cohnella thailandensis TaxID=557557 RepID=A0A841T0X5_9BACL|nr:peptidylprolyl isomerase [Cohnella thailandensis]MBB6635507.1 peptidylprolyl isomerase [Cohnella thailandensis]MBP1974887.1 foldase protein PrsA [Cohnella thailandensis]